MRTMLATAAVLIGLAVPAAATAKPNDVSATTFFRVKVAANYSGPVRLGDGRGCAKAKPWLFICTADVPVHDASVYGTVTVAHRRGVHGYGGWSMTTVVAGSSNKITQWFARTDGGCQTDDCAGTVYRTSGG